MEYHLSLTVVVISVISLEMAITGCVAQDIVIQAPVGEDVLLPCPFNYGLEDVDLLQWRRIYGDTVVHLAEMNAQGITSAESPHHNMSSNLDLLIRNVSFGDAGRYQCHVSHKDIMIPSTGNYILLHLYGNRTVARLMQPPNKANKASSYYQAVVPAKVPTKANSDRRHNANSHFYSSRVKYALEMSAKIVEMAMVYSADNKHKVRVGDSTLAVDRRVQIGRFFPTEDAPNYHDHDFPVPGYLLTPSGYLQMNPTQGTAVDELGRERFGMPTRSKSTIVLRSPHSAMNIAAHLNDLVNHVDVPSAVVGGKRAMVLVVDGGPDFNVNHSINELYFGRFFRDTNLDGLIVTSYCPGDSALNPIEHLWAPCTKALTGVYLPSTLQGESRPPVQQGGLSPEERVQKEHAVFNEAMRRIKDSYWKNIKFGEHVTTMMEQSGAAPQPYGSTYDTDKRILGSSSREFRRHAMSTEVKFMCRHMDKRIGTIIFAKCANDPTCVHCSSNPPSLSEDDMEILRNFPSPTPSRQHPGHFATFKEALELPREAPCQHLPIFNEKGLGRCPVTGCRYVFTSKKDPGEHRLRIHE